jgi:hypothetical protein
VGLYPHDVMANTFASFTGTTILIGVSHEKVSPSANNFDYAPDHKFPEIAFFCDDMMKGAIRARPNKRAAAQRAYAINVANGGKADMFFCSANVCL